MAGAGVLGGAGGKKKKKKDDGEAKKNLKPGDLPPRRGRAWNPGAGPRPDKDKEGGGGGGGEGERLSNIWFEASAALALPTSIAKSAKELPQREMDAKEEVARKALEERVATHEKQASRSGSADSKWLKVVRTSGTAADKIAAATVLAQEDPVANMKSLETLLALLEKARVKGGKRGAVQAVAALQELFRDALLPPDRKLKYFSEQPLEKSGAGPLERKRLLYWYIEDMIKRAYTRFVNALDALSRDPLEVLKEKSVKAAYDMLKCRPEQERGLLNILVNKLGDPHRRTASNAAHLLLELVSKDHPAMKRVVAREVETFCFRRGVGLKAQYYAAVLLNQFPLNHTSEGEKLAAQLVEFYFSVFQILHKRSKEEAENGGAAADGDDAKGSKDKKQRWRDGAKKGGRGGGRGGRGGRGGPGGRGGRGKKPDGLNGLRAPATPLGAGVDARVVSALLTGINRAFPYVDADAVEPLVEKVSPALFAIAHSPNLGGALQALSLLLQLLSSRAAVSDRFYRALYSVLLHPGAPRGSSAAAGQLMSLTFRALKDDPQPARAAAMVKRLLQVAAHAPASFACGSLMLISEFLRLKPSHWDAVRQPREGDEGDDVEHFVDVDDDDDDKENGLAEDASDSDSDSDEKKLKAAKKAMESAAHRYDMSKRDPLYAKADQSCWWELATLERNVHPSVAAMARSLLRGTNVEYDGDPLADMTLTAFLDKWLQKKNKSRTGVSKGGSSTMAKHRDQDAAAAAAAVAPGTAEFAALTEAEVEPSDVFFHRYYANKSESKKAKKKKRDDDGSDDEGSDDESEEDDDAAAERKKKAKAKAGIEGVDEDDDEEDDDDVDLGDLEMPDSDSDDEEEVGRGKKGRSLKASIDTRSAGFTGDSDDEVDAALDAEERKEEKSVDSDKFNYGALAKAYGYKPGYLLHQKSSEPEESEEEDDDEEGDDGVQVWEYDGPDVDSDDEVQRALAQAGSDDDEEEELEGEGEEDNNDEEEEDDEDSESESEEPKPKAKKKVADEPITLVSAVPKSSKNQGIDTTFASYDDYMSMIESDFDVNPPIQNSDEDDSDGDGEDGEALDTALASDGEEEDEEPIKKPKTPPSSGKKKGPSPRMTRSRAKLKSEGLEPPSKRRK